MEAFFKPEEYDALPVGVVVTNDRQGVVYVNDFARSQIFALSGKDNGNLLLDGHFFFTVDMAPFHLLDCMKNMLKSRRLVFHKTLVVRPAQGKERLVFFSARRQAPKHGGEGFLLTLADISSEMDCIARLPSSFGQQSMWLQQRIIGKDLKISTIYRMIELAADSDVNVMITGESGTGKEMVADAIHRLSERRNSPFVKVNCAALSESLLESELFGHVKGAFTGAISHRTGRFEEAAGGSIFLDEIGEISPALQVKLLRVIQEKTIERVGDHRPIKVDMRIVAATNRDLRSMAQSKEFREDLFYRLNVFSVHMPALRERVLDIPLLCDHFMGVFNEETGKLVKGMDRDAMALMMRYPWPGNIRELRNAMEYAFVLVRGSVISAEDLPAVVRDHGEVEMGGGHYETQRQALYGYTKTRGGRLRITSSQLKAVLDAHEGNQTRAAEYLGISRVALWKKLKKFGY